MIIKNNTKSWETLIKSYVIAFVILLLALKSELLCFLPTFGLCSLSICICLDLK